MLFRVNLFAKRVDFAGDFSFLRASNTSPMLITRFAADSETLLTSIQAQLRREMLKIDPTLILPF